jgi:hypothetical protein
MSRLWRWAAVVSRRARVQRREAAAGALGVHQAEHGGAVLADALGSGGGVGT